MAVSLDRFLAELSLIHRGGVGDVVRRLSSGGSPPDVRQVANELVRTGVLTPYQAAALYQGKGKGLRLGPYVVLDKIGSGGMGMVFKAVHRDLDAVVALKLLPPSFARRDRAVVERFRREAESLARLNHPNIVCCFENVREVDGVYYLVMEYVEGQDLKTLVETMGVFPVVQAIEVMLQTAKGLQSAHTLQVIHRDVKPANLMLDHTNTIRILDFGLARVMVHDLLSIDDGDDTASRAVMGTIPYMAPEQAVDATKADARSDIYSLGCTLHFLLTGQPPYQRRTWMEMLAAHRKAPVPSLRAARPSVPDYLDNLFVRMMAKDPADRPRTMAAVVASTELAMAESRARPPSSQTIPVRPADRPNEPDPGPAFSLDDLEIASPSRFRAGETDGTGRRLRPPEDPVNLGALARHPLVLAALIVVLILILDWLLRSTT